jgi:hypothetical protein
MRIGVLVGFGLLVRNMLAVDADHGVLSFVASRTRRAREERSPGHHIAHIARVCGCVRDVRDERVSLGGGLPLCRRFDYTLCGALF